MRRPQAIAEKTHATIVVGLMHIDKPAKYNEARIYTRRERERAL